MLYLFCVLLVVAQPTVNVTKAMTLIVLNEVRICFIFLDSLQISGRLETISSGYTFPAATFAVLWSSVYKTLGQYASVPDDPCTAGEEQKHGRVLATTFPAAYSGTFRTEATACLFSAKGATLSVFVRCEAT
jgi:hypothetical protein